MALEYPEVGEIRRILTDEIFIAMGFSPTGWQRRLFGPLFWLPTYRFVNLVSTFDRRVGEEGLSSACQWILPHFIENLTVEGTANVPTSGPLLLVANHPGAYDGMAILAHFPRNDIKVVISGAPFFRSFPTGERHMIHTSKDAFLQMTVVRQSIRHLREGGCLLIFPTGQVDPDPAVLPGAHEALAKWSPSIELFLRKAPQTLIQIAIVSGILAPKFVRHPLTKLRKGRLERQKLAEFMQVIQQMVFGKKYNLTPRVSFAQPFSLADLGLHLDSKNTLMAIVERAQNLLTAHMMSEAGQSPGP